MNENDNPVLRWLQSQPLPMNTVPGTNTNSNRTVGTQQVQRRVQVEDETPKTRQEGELRNWKRRRQTKKSADQEATERRLAEANQRTWRSDVADALHLVGEGAMASTPITATSYFGAKALNDVIHGNANAGTALDVAFAAMPWMRPLRATSVATTADQLEGTKMLFRDLKKNNIQRNIQTLNGETKSIRQILSEMNITPNSISEYANSSIDPLTSMTKRMQDTNYLSKIKQNNTFYEGKVKVFDDLSSDNIPQELVDRVRTSYLEENPQFKSIPQETIDNVIINNAIKPKLDVWNPFSYIVKEKPTGIVVIQNPTKFPEAPKKFDLYG